MIFVVKAVAFAFKSFAVLVFLLIPGLEPMNIKYFESTEAFLPWYYQMRLCCYVRISISIPYDVVILPDIIAV